MSIFSDNTKNEIPMSDRFVLSNINYDEFGEVHMIAYGDPFTRLHNKNWEYPYYLMDQFEPKYWERCFKKFIKHPCQVPDVVTYYFFAPNQFTATCDYDRINLKIHDIIKDEYYGEYGDPYNSILSMLINNSLKHAMIDELFTPEIYGKDESQSYSTINTPYSAHIWKWPTEQDSYMNYWRSVGDKMIAMMHDMVKPEVGLAIKLSINQSIQHYARFWFSFDFMSYKGNPLMWWYIDRSKNWHISNSPKDDYDPRSFGVYMDNPSSMHPCFDIYTDINIKPINK